jgi:hypothetical protein
MHRYNICPQDIETIKIVQFHTAWKPKITAKITRSVEAAMEAIDHNTTDMKVFTDGSGMEGKIGAAAILYRNGRLKAKLQYNLGAQWHHTVYEGKGVGIILGTKLISRGVWLATIYIDNQATIMATQLMKPSPGHHIFDVITRASRC